MTTITTPITKEVFMSTIHVPGGNVFTNPYQSIVDANRKDLVLFHRKSPHNLFIPPHFLLGNFFDIVQLDILLSLSTISQGVARRSVWVILVSSPMAMVEVLHLVVLNAHLLTYMQSSFILSNKVSKLLK